MVKAFGKQTQTTAFVHIDASVVGSSECRTAKEWHEFCLLRRLSPESLLAIFRELSAAGLNLPGTNSHLGAIVGDTGDFWISS